MKTLVAIGVITASAAFLADPAAAHERAGDAALGAIAGAVVAGPVGLVAGGVIGYTAGPGIASEWGLRHRHHSRPRPRLRKIQ
jgi:hypothetical protein